MSKEHSTPWIFQAEDKCEDTPILDANGDAVLVRDNGVYPPDLETCREIVDAMNEREHLRDLVRRFADYAETYHALGVQGKSLVAEAHAALGESGEIHATDTADKLKKHK